ncbi:MAG: hypothetical protein R3C04_05570 [Hyphomonas sp.]
MEDGQERDVLLAQQHTCRTTPNISSRMSRRSCADSYIRVNGQPMLALYRPS